MHDKPVYLGIDLGTTNSAAAIFDGEQITLVRNAHGSTLTPSIVRIDARGLLTVGSRARRFVELDPGSVSTEFKRLMGTEQKIQFPAAKTARRPEELSAEVLKSLRADARDQLSFEPRHAVITVPALFELPQSKATSEAAQLAGFERVELLQEPIASALAAGWSDKTTSDIWLVYDLGGGTFDASLLETKDGMLRVMGHDGDNFLGGRDFDAAIADWALAELGRAHEVTISRSDPRHAASVRKLRHVIEDAKIELTRATSTVIVLPQAFDVDGLVIDVELELDRATLERLCMPLVERSLDVCRRLLATCRIAEKAVRTTVLVGGPTLMPLVRERLESAGLGEIAEGHDPMTLVARGAALYAATAGLDTRPRAERRPTDRKMMLQYPAMTSDPAPHVIGRVVKGGAGSLPAEVKLERDDERWASPAAAIDAEGVFQCQVELVPQRSNLFHIRAVDETGAAVATDPSTLTIMHGLTMGDPPLSRTIGVALANNCRQIYFERGLPLPAKRRFVHRTVETVSPGATEMLLRIPIVQGEYEQAHLCRLVGSISISGKELSASLPAGSPVEVTLELDRGGRLSATAFVPSLDLLVDHVAQLVIPDVTPASLKSGHSALANRVTQVRAEGLRRAANATLNRLAPIERDLGVASRDIDAAGGGDQDAAQRARRTLLDIDAQLDELEAERRWPELDRDAQAELTWAARWVEEYGSAEEKALMKELATALEKARKSHDVIELQQHMRLVHNLGSACFFRWPEAWSARFDWLASKVDACLDLPRARKLVEHGRKAQEKKDQAALKSIVQELAGLMPADHVDRQRGFNSGVR